MAKKEIKTDLWVYDLLKEAELDLCPQGSDIVELNNALKTASKAQTGKAGYPEYCGVVEDFVIVIEDKANTDDHIKRNDNDLICQAATSIKDFAINGALHYGIHLAKKILATRKSSPSAYQATKNATKSHRSLLTNVAAIKNWKMWKHSLCSIKRTLVSITPKTS